MITRLAEIPCLCWVWAGPPSCLWTKLGERPAGLWDGRWPNWSACLVSGPRLLPTALSQFMLVEPWANGHGDCRCQLLV